MMAPPRRFTLFPYTTLFRSHSRYRPLPPLRGLSAAGSHCPGFHRRRGSTALRAAPEALRDRKSTRLNSSHGSISYAVVCLKKKRTAMAEATPLGLLVKPIYD